MMGRVRGLAAGCWGQLAQDRAGYTSPTTGGREQISIDAMAGVNGSPVEILCQAFLFLWTYSCGHRFSGPYRRPDRCRSVVLVAGV